MNLNTELLNFKDGIILESGEKLDSFDLMIETYGELNKARSNAILICERGTPIFLDTVESVKSLCNLDIGNLLARNINCELAIIKFPSAFSKSIGFTL